ncbi:hypothetical protein [Paludibacterium yongneupense]|uniref:hypothetical protein n=1 Tax=Paludibacterium yongneupense TaxID=400061 RepID=UPI000407BE60|nr:hypothetical protein [Paludibacterium yongneupense]
MTFSRLALIALVAFPCLAAAGDDISTGDGAHELAIGLDLKTRPGGSSRIETVVNGHYDTDFGSLFSNDGEAGIALPAPGGYFTLAAADTSAWEYGPGQRTLAWVARYHLELPRGTEISMGIAQGQASSAKQWVTSLDLPLLTRARTDFDLALTGSRSNAEFRREAGIAAGDGWRQEEFGWMLNVSHPLTGRWAGFIGAGRHWQASGTGHEALWQTRIGVVWQWTKQPVGADRKTLF